jgi:hypothetical protein
MKTNLLSCVIAVSIILASQTANAECKRAVTFAISSNGSLAYRLPNVKAKWFDSALKKNPDICFSQYGSGRVSDAMPFLIVLSTSQSAFNGLYPSYRTNTSTSTVPISGSGTITGNNGSTWNYTYQGQDTVTTTTTERTDVPYQDTTVGLYAMVYDDKGNAIGSAQRTETFRQGGDPNNTLGYNLGSRLAAIHIKEHLLEDALKRILAAPFVERAVAKEEAVAGPEPTAVPSSSPSNSSFEELSIHATAGEKNILMFANDKGIVLKPFDAPAGDATRKCIVDAASPACIDNWPKAQQSFARLTELGSAIRAANDSKDDLLVTVAHGLVPLWQQFRDTYCEEDHGASFTDLDGSISRCK